MRKVDDGKRRRKKKKKEKTMSFIVATNVVASWLPIRRPTGTPHARAKMMIGATHYGRKWSLIIILSKLI